LSSLAWERRPLEERASYNPAFLALLLRQSADGYRGEAERTFPVPLAFIVLPLVLHRPTREAAPKTVATSMPIWLQEHQFIREGFAGRARGLAPAVREALVIGLQRGVLALDDGGIYPAAEPARARHGTSETRALLARARFLGRWLARAGDVETIYFLWGVRP
jgi:ABC-three component (ABC-3C) system Middle Component 3